MGRLTTHVLDLAHGRPGEGVAIALYRCTPSGRLLLGHHVTNADGRCDAPLLLGSAFQLGTYELEFWIGDYYERLGLEVMQPRFLDVVTLRFGIADEAGHYHVPLLVSPYGYTTYRGS